MTTPKRGLEEMIQELKELEKKATPGPWEWYGSETIRTVENNNAQTVLQFADIAEPNAELIAESRNALPKLLEIIETQKKALEFYANPPTFMGSDGGCTNEDGSFTTLPPTKRTLIPGKQRARDCLKRCEEILNKEKA